MDRICFGYIYATGWSCQHLERGARRETIEMGPNRLRGRRGITCVAHNDDLRVDALVISGLGVRVASIGHSCSKPTVASRGDGAAEGGRGEQAGGGDGREGIMAERATAQRSDQGVVRQPIAVAVRIRIRSNSNTATRGHVPAFARRTYRHSRDKIARKSRPPIQSLAIGCVAMRK